MNARDYRRHNAAVERRIAAHFERANAGDQHVIPGTERATDATMAQRRANAPLRPTRIQLPIGGLFSDTHTQSDLIDAIRGMK